MPHPTNARSLGLRLLNSSSGALLALALAFIAAHYYSPPNLNGAARNNPWLERDSCLALVSGLLALGVGLYAGRAVVQSRLLGAVLARVLFWVAVTMLLALAWGSSVSLLALLIAPSHGFAFLRLADLVRAWRSERIFRK